MTCIGGITSNDTSVVHDFESSWFCGAVLPMIDFINNQHLLDQASRKKKPKPANRNNLQNSSFTCWTWPKGHTNDTNDGKIWHSRFSSVMPHAGMPQSVVSTFVCPSVVRSTPQRCSTTTTNPWRVSTTSTNSLWKSELRIFLAGQRIGSKERLSYLFWVHLWLPIHGFEEILAG